MQEEFACLWDTKQKIGSWFQCGGCNWKCLDRIFPEMNAFNLTIDMVAGSKEGKCGLKYVIHSPRGAS